MIFKQNHTAYNMIALLYNRALNKLHILDTTFSVTFVYFYSANKKKF